MEQSMSCAGGSHASPLVSQVSKKARKTPDTSGLLCSELSKSVSPLGSLARMLVGSSIWRSDLCSLTWKVKVTKCGLSLFQLAVSVRTTAENGAGLWATPNTMEHLPQRSPEALLRQATTTRKGRLRPANLREQVDPETVKMWPTPAHRDYKGCRGEAAQARKGNPADTLPNAVRVWPTPNASDFRDRGCMENPSIQRRVALGKQIMLTMLVKETRGAGSLNPDWVEPLMGYPVGWTDLGTPTTLTSQENPA